MARGPEDERTFLEAFLREFPAPPGPGGPLPGKLRDARVAPDEVEGVLVELALTVLGSRDAPPRLAASLTRAAVDQLTPADPAAEEPPEPDPDDRVLLEAGPLQARFLSKLWDVCRQWRAPGPPAAPGRPLPISVHAIRNSRRKMEDRHVALPAFNQLFGLADEPERAYLAVFDGHGGADAADFAAAQLHVHLARHPDLGTDPAGALRAAFRLTDDMFLRKAKREGLRSGSTGVCALLAGPAVHVAWLGDSQVVLVRRGEALTLMEPHRPERQDEKERVEALGGFVSYVDCWRVNGTLAVSRAIGDASQKPYVSGEADSATRELSGSEDYLLLACDGFFDAVEPQEAAELVRRHLATSGGAEAGVAEGLVAAAREGGSGDNITVLVAFLRDPRDLLAGGEPGEAPVVFPGPSPP
ncbi:protein phosphatase 1F [Tachyglossus aculeatus]|uniref:protein phosphatase 1F n=1 Tax=Tachyglossus aculeatus TaxID=9261 RepID=UPI0018F27FBB|nr:protein phosphatase 1F [Tachyglossus aculeatus]